MAPPKYTPDKTTFQQWLAETPPPTHQQMADRVFEQTGHRVSRAAITLALMTYGLTKTRPRYKDYLPWRVRTDHIKAYPARMLRLMGRRDAGGELTDKEQALLEAWLLTLANEDLIVAYDGEDETGFHYVDSRFKDHDDPGLPIRKKQIHLNRL